MAFKNETYTLKKASSYRHKRPALQIKSTTWAMAYGYGLLSLRLQGYARKDVEHGLSLLQHHVTHTDCNFVAKLGHTLQNATPASSFTKQKNYDARALTDLQFQQRHIHNASLEQQQRRVQKTFTVIRSPFVYKKTREQFGLQKHTKVINLILKRQHVSFICRSLSTLTLPCELKLVLNA